jgi:hypothetical protein
MFEDPWRSFTMLVLAGPRRDAYRNVFILQHCFRLSLSLSDLPPHMSQSFVKLLPAFMG